MRKLLLFLLVMMLATVGVSQDTQSRVYTITGSSTQPTAAYSASGSLILLTSPEGYRVINASDNKQLWFVPALASGSRANVAAFSRDNASVWALTNPSTGEVSEFVATSGVFKRKFNLFAAGTNPVSILPLGSSIAGASLSNPKVNGVDVYQLDVVSYNTADLTLLQTKTLTHTSAGLDPRWAYGFRNKDVVWLFNQELDVRTGVIRTDSANVGADKYEYWTVGIDVDFGVIQLIAKADSASLSGYTVTGVRRLNGTNILQYTRTIDAIGGTWEQGPMQFSRLPNGTLVGLMSNKASTSASVFAWQTGVRVFDTDLSAGTAGYVWSDGLLNRSNGRVYLSYPAGANQPLRPGFAQLGNTSTTFVAQAPFITKGSAYAAEVGALGTVVAGKGPFVGFYDASGNLKWSLTDVTPSFITAPSPVNGNVAIIVPGKLSIRSFANGTELASFAGDFTSTAWIGDSKLVVNRDDQSTSFINFTGSGVTHIKTFESFLTGGLSVSPDFAYVAGFNADQLKVVKVSDFSVVNTTVGNIAGVGSRTEWLSNSVVVVPENQSAKSITLRRFTVGASLVEGTPFTHTFSTSGAIGNFQAEVSPDGKLAAFGGYSTQGADGVYKGEVAIRRLSDGLLVGRFLDQTSPLHGLRFSTNSRLLTLTFNGSTTQTSDFTVINVPNWVISATAPTQIFSGNPFLLTVTLNQPARAGGQRVTLSSDTPGYTFNAETLIAAGGTTANIAITPPITDKTITATLSVRGTDQNTDIVSVTRSVTISPPLLTVFTATPSPIIGSSANITLGYTVAGKIATATQPLTFSSNNTALINPPATGSITSGNTGTVSVPTGRAAADTNVILRATLGARTLQATVRVLQPALLAIATVDAPSRGGDDATYRLTIRNAAPAAGEPITVTTVGPEGTKTFTVTIPSGKVTADFTVPTSTVSTSTPFTVSATSLGSAVVTATTTLNPADLAFFSLSSATVQGGKSVKGLIALDGLAGPSTSVTVSSSDARATVPASVSISNGLTFAEFTVNTTAGVRQTVTITVTLGTKTFTKTLTILP